MVFLAFMRCQCPCRGTGTYACTGKTDASSVPYAGMSGYIITHNSSTMGYTSGIPDWLRRSNGYGNAAMRVKRAASGVIYPMTIPGTAACCSDYEHRRRPRKGGLSVRCRINRNQRRSKKQSRKNQRQGKRYGRKTAPYRMRNGFKPFIV